MGILHLGEGGRMTRPRIPMKKINGEALKYQIKVKRLNQEWISEALGKNKSYLSKCISLGRVQPQTIREIERMYRIPASSYVIDENQPTDLFEQLTVQMNESAPDPVIAPDPEPDSEKSQRKVSVESVKVSERRDRVTDQRDQIILHQRELINQQMVTIDQLLKHIRSITTPARSVEDIKDKWETEKK